MVSKEELEITIGWTEAEKEATVYTNIPKWLSRCKQLGMSVAMKDSYGTTFVCPKNWIKIKKPRVLTEEQRQRITAQLKKAKINRFCLTPQGKSQVETQDTGFGLNKES